MAEIEHALVARDFATFARITMQDSNQFHAVCLDTYPPIFYMNDVSRQIVQMITQFNTTEGGIKVTPRSSLTQVHSNTAKISF